MYADPALIRDNTVKISLNDLEDDLITAAIARKAKKRTTSGARVLPIRKR